MAATTDESVLIRLIQVVERNPAIYDHRMKEHSNRNIQRRLWRAVAKETNLADKACKEKWRCIRQSYLRHLRQKSRCVADAKLHKDYYLADFLRFLEPHTKSKSSPKRSTRLEKSEEEEEGDEDDETDADDAKYEEKSWPSPPPPVIAERLKKRMTDTVEDEDKVRQRIGRSALVDDDSDLNFFRSLLPEMRQMTSLQKLHFKSAVINAMANILSAGAPNYAYPTPASTVSSDDLSMQEILVNRLVATP